MPSSNQDKNNLNKNNLNGKISVFHTDKEVVINADQVLDREEYKETHIEDEIKKAKIVIDEKKTEILQRLELERNEVLKKGYEEGLNKAYHEVRMQVEDELKEKISEAGQIYEKSNEHYQFILDKADQYFVKFLEEKKEQINELVIRLVEKVIYQKIENNEVDFSTMYEKIIEKVMQDSKKVFVWVNPKNYRYLEDFEKKEKRIEILVSKDIAEDEIRVEADAEIYDASIKAQIEILKEMIRG